MLLQNIRARIRARLSGDSEAGFTLIELLVVMLILGILAAIAIPAFFNQKEKAKDSQAKETAHSAQVAVETYATEKNGSYAGVTIGDLHRIEPTISGTPGAKAAGTTAATEGVIVTGTATGYTIQSISTNGNDFEIVNTAGEMTFPCTKAGTGGCPEPATGTGEIGNWAE